MADRSFADLAAFTAACRERGLTTVILAWRSEWGPRLDGARDGDYRQRRECRVLAYQAGDILAWETADGERAELHRELEDAGLTVEERCRNLTSFGTGHSQRS